MRRILGTLGLLAAALLVAAPATPAYAIPSGGASADTKGTSASVSPRTLSPGDTIHFTVSGFPAGETVSIKIDDQKFCSTLVSFGACVVHQQPIGSNGVASGSFVLPADIPAGKHWLRFLASSDDGGKITPYSCRGNSDFTVVARTTTEDQAGDDPTAPSTAAPSTTVGGSTTTGPTASGSAAPAAPASVAPAGTVLTVPSASGASEATAPSASPAESTPAEPTGSTDEPAGQPEAAAVTEESHVPVIGIVGLVVLAGAAVSLALRVRRGTR